MLTDAPPAPPAIVVADQRETKALAGAIRSRVTPAAPRKPKTFLARLDLKPGEKRKYVSPHPLKGDVQLLGGKVNGRGGLMSTAEPAKNGYNFYKQGVVVKMRQGPHGRVKVVAVNTGPRKARVGVRYKRG